MTIKLCDHFDVVTHRDIKNFNEISLAEIAQFTMLSTDSVYVADAEIRKEWKHEIVVDHPISYLTEDGMCYKFLDESVLTIKSRKSKSEKLDDLFNMQYGI